MLSQPIEGDIRSIYPVQALIYYASLESLMMHNMSLFGPKEELGQKSEQGNFL